MGNDTLKAVAIANVLTLTGAGAISLMPFTPLPLDIALGGLAASAFGITGWLATFTIHAHITKFRKPTK